MSLSFRQPRRKRSGFICPGSLYLAVALLFTSAPPATHGQSLHQLYHRSWTVRDGAPGSVTTIAQAADGFLWLYLSRHRDARRWPLDRLPSWRRQLSAEWAHHEFHAG